MNRSKKYLKKSGVDHEALKEAVTKQNQKQDQQQSISTLKDSDLFKVASKVQINEKRQALAKDRFKQSDSKNSLKSKTEQALIKKILEKGPPGKQNVPKEGDEFANLWATPLDQSRKQQEFRAFSKSVTKVKAVITPHAGQSVNPSAASHGQVLKQAVTEEVREIEKNFKGTIKQHALAVDMHVDEESDDAEVVSKSDPEDQMNELINKPVSREKKKTQTELNRKVSHSLTPNF